MGKKGKKWKNIHITFFLKPKVGKKKLLLKGMKRQKEKRENVCQSVMSKYFD